MLRHVSETPVFTINQNSSQKKKDKNSTWSIESAYGDQMKYICPR